MAWESSDRRAQLPPDWARLVAAVKARAGGRCEARLPRSGKRCPRPGTDCDHKDGPLDHSMSNLQWLCGEHHKIKTSREAHAARETKKGSRYRPPEDHPGALS